MAPTRSLRSEPAGRPGGSLALVVALLAVAWGVWSAYSAWWTTDDAFISFRYAENLVAGHGLVFNHGELVEGYSNFLWTLWVAMGLALGLGAEAWANFWGILFYGGSILLLAANHQRLARRGSLSPWLIPLAALAAALHRDWAIFATSGLETSLFTFLLLAGFLLAVWNLDKPHRLAAAGLIFGLAALTRPDGVIPAVIAGLFVLAFARPRWKSAAGFGLSFAAVWLPFLLWRLSYYGELLPNTYYAKSGHLSWYDQGWHYLVLYLEKYWVVLLGPLLLLAALARRLRPGAASGTGGRQAEEVEVGRLIRDQAFLAASITVVYTFAVVRVGGDFMFARFLIPVTPFFLLLLELGWIGAFRRRPALGLGVAVLCCAGMVLTPVPVTGKSWSRGVADEWSYYDAREIAESDRWAAVLGRYFDGLPVRVAFYGSEARVAYKAGFPVAIESHTGLTDPVIARQALARRGRVGHEKEASPRYLIEERRAHFSFSRVPEKALGEYIPEVVVEFGDGVYGRVLHWDPELMTELSRRGARIPDFVRLLEGYIGRMDQFPDDEVARDYDRFKRFYFDHVYDPARQEAFLQRLQ